MGEEREKEEFFSLYCSRLEAREKISQGMSFFQDFGKDELDS